MLWRPCSHGHSMLQWSGGLPALLCAPAAWHQAESRLALWADTHQAAQGLSKELTGLCAREMHLVRLWQKNLDTIRRQFTALSGIVNGLLRCAYMRSPPSACASSDQVMTTSCICNSSTMTLLHTLIP